MNQRSSLFAFTMLFLSILCLVVGYWLGTEEKREIAQSYLNNIVDQQKQYAINTKISLDMLIALQNGNNELVLAALTTRVKNGLKSAPGTGLEPADNLTQLGAASKSTLARAADYQSKFCTDNCLGL